MSIRKLVTVKLSITVNVPLSCKDFDRIVSKGRVVIR